MDLKQIKELMAAMGKAGMKRVRIKDKSGLDVELEKECAPVAIAPVFAPSSAPPPLSVAPLAAAEAPKAKEDAPGNYVTSPMVGTFYGSASPEDPHFVKIGDIISEDSVLCIIEAMKVMNEVKSGMKGKIAEILVENGDPVEFGTRIFRIV